MTFEEATDQLFNDVGHADLAKAMGVSVALVRQARLSPSAKAYRAPPKKWELAVFRLAEKQITQSREVIEMVRKGGIT